MISEGGSPVQDADVPEEPGGVHHIRNDDAVMVEGYARDDKYSILRGLLLLPTILGSVFMIISVPQVAWINHLVGFMFIVASIPCCCLQIYISLERIEGENLKTLMASRGDQQWFLQNLFLWIGCLSHCILIDSYLGFVYASLIFLVMMLMWQLLWIAQRKREALFSGKAPGSHEEREDLVAEIGKVSAIMFFSYYNVFHAWGCVGSSYDTPKECVGVVFAQLVVVFQVSLLSIVEFITVRGGYYSYFDVFTFQVDTVDVFIMALVALTVLCAVFIFSTSNIENLYYAPATDGGMTLTPFASYMVIAVVVIWVFIVVLCRLSDRWRQTREHREEDQRQRLSNDADNEEEQREVMLVQAKPREL